jgi:hypothetical protein
MGPLKGDRKVSQNHARIKNARRQTQIPARARDVHTHLRRRSLDPSEILGAWGFGAEISLEVIAAANITILSSFKDSNGLNKLY